MTMNNRITKTLRAKAGFTLVELIVVIAILGILAGVGTVGYSGYIKKVNEAADQQLLGFVNQAFAAACLENGKDASNLDSVPELTLTGDAGAKKVGTVTMYNDEFQRYLSGNDGAFKVISALYFDSTNGVFKNFAESVYTSLTDSFDPETIEKLVASGFFTYEGLGVSGLMDKVATVSDLAADVAGMSAEFRNMLSRGMPDMMAAMGYNADDPNQVTAFQEKYNAMLAAKKAELASQYPEKASDELESLARYQILANNAVLQAAKNTSGTESELLTKLQAGFDVDTVKDMLKSDNSGEGLAEAALLYSMYTAYAYSLPEDDDARSDAIAATEDINTFLAVANEDSGFQTYLRNEDGKAGADLKGYLAAMEMISDTTGDTKNAEAVSNLLLNGFDDDEFKTLLGQITAR